MTINAQDMVDLYIEAEQALLAGKTATMNGRTLTMENLQEIREGRQEWEIRVRQQAASAAGKKPRSPALVSFD